MGSTPPVVVEKTVARHRESGKPGPVTLNTEVRKLKENFSFRSSNVL